MKYLIPMCLTVVLVGCSAQPRTIVSQDIDEGVVGARPEGFPRTVVKALPDQPGFCIEVTESWKERQHEGKTIWLKQKTVESVSCTREQWKRLTMDQP